MVRRWFNGLLGGWLNRLLPVVVLFVGLSIVVVGLFNCQGQTLLAILIVGGLLAAFAAIRMTIDSIKKSGVVEKDYEQLRERYERLRKDKEGVDQELHESYQTPVRIQDIRAILDMGVLEVDLELTKFFDEKYSRDENNQLQRLSADQEEANYRFIGGLKAEFTARYGIKLTDIRVEEDIASRKLYVSGANPVFLGTGGGRVGDIYWESSIMLGFSYWGNVWQTNKNYASREGNIRDELMAKFRKKLNSGPDEINWLRKPLQEHIGRLIQGVFAPRGYSVEFVDDSAGKDFIPLLKYLDKQHIQALEKGRRKTT